MAHRLEAGTIRSEIATAGRRFAEDMARRVESQLDELGYRGCAVGKPLRTFVSRILPSAKDPYIGVIYRDEGYHRPTIDLCIRWPEPIRDDDTNQSRALDCISEYHGKLADCLDPIFDTFLDFVDPRAYPNMVTFRAALATWASQAKRGVVLASCDFGSYRDELP